MKDPRHQFVTFLGIRGGDAGAFPVTFWPAVLRGCGWRATHDWSHPRTFDSTPQPCTAHSHGRSESFYRAIAAILRSGCLPV